MGTFTTICFTIIVCSLLIGISPDQQTDDGILIVKWCSMKIIISTEFKLRKNPKKITHLVETRKTTYVTRYPKEHGTENAIHLIDDRLVYDTGYVSIATMKTHVDGKQVLVERLKSLVVDSNADGESMPIYDGESFAANWKFRHRLSSTHVLCQENQDTIHISTDDDCCDENDDSNNDDDGNDNCIGSLYGPEIMSNERCFTESGNVCVYCENNMHCSNLKRDVRSHRKREHYSASHKKADGIALPQEMLTDKKAMNGETLDSFLHVDSLSMMSVCKIICILACVYVFLSNVRHEFPGSKMYIPDLLCHQSLVNMSNSIKDTDMRESKDDGKYYPSNYSRGKGLDYMLDWNKTYAMSAGETWSSNAYSVFSVESYIERVASFSGKPPPTNMSLLRLSKHGFYHTGEGGKLQCSDCASIVQSKDIVSSPSDRKYHASPRCQFATTGGAEDIGSACEGVDQDLLAQIKRGKIDTQQEVKVILETKGDFPSSPGLAADKPEAGACKHDSLTETAQESEGKALTDLKYSCEKPGARKQENEIKKGTTFEWIDKNQIKQEAGLAENHGSNTELSSVKCDKHETHSKLFPVSSLPADEIPSDMRNDDVKALIKMSGKLVCNIEVSEKSRMRPRSDEEIRPIGSGTAFVEGVDRAERWMKELNEEEGLSCPQQHDAEERDFYFSVTTSTHVIFDQSEAKNAKVEFFYDSTDRQSVVSVFGVAVKHSDTEGEYKSHLICKTREKQFIKWLFQARQELNEHIAKMHAHTREILTKNCFVVFHPHGFEKRVSFGRCAVTKYELIEKENRKEKEMVYLSDKESLSTERSQREVLHYTAPTCPGSSGSPLFTFRHRTSVAEDVAGNTPAPPLELELVMWIHNGMEKSTGLGSSAMKAVEPRFNNCTDEHPVSLDTLATNLRKHTTVARKGTPPLYPGYYTWEERLATFKDHRYNSKSHHSPEELAVGGFFYTGTSGDCVRCFYCGLGLKAWRTGDDMYVEHCRARPNCGFAKLCQAFKGNLNLDKLKEGTRASIGHGKVLTPSLAISLLEKENRLLKLRQTCKMCFRNDSKELFLPCGEILVCDTCTEILSICPSCDKKIEATVSVYLS